MTTKEMNSQEHGQTARDFLVVSDREFAAGDDLQGSENCTERPPTSYQRWPSNGTGSIEATAP